MSFDRFRVPAGALALSYLAALGAATQLVDYYWYGEDLSLIVPPATAFVVVAAMIFGVTAPRAGSAHALGLVALALAAAAFAMVLIPGLVGEIARRSKNPALILRGQDTQIALAVLLPVLLAIATQWWVVRRGWMQARGEDAATAWPWITTVAACVIAFSPIGLAILGAALKRSATDWLYGLWVTTSLGFAAIVLVLGIVEWRIRRRRLAARATPPTPS